MIRNAIKGALLLCLATVASADPRISEFMASNATGLQDEDGEYSDWIEGRNPGADAVGLSGWYLTDDAADLTQWRFPAVSIPAHGYVVVFASGKDRAIAGGELHANFQLDTGGEYLALVRPDGETVAHDFSPAFPNQRSDVSYGIHTPTVTTNLVLENHPATAFVPTSDVLTDTWTGAAGNEPFDDSAGAGWIQGTNGFGFSSSGSVIPAETKGFALQDRATLDGASGSIFGFPEIPFTEDGRVLTWTFFSNAGGAVNRTITPLLFRKLGSAYEITGIGETRTNAGTGEQSFDFGLTAGSDAVAAGVHYFGFKDGSNTADSDRPEVDAIALESVDLSAHLGLLAPGTNVLALHGLNNAPGDSAFLIDPRLAAATFSAPTELYVTTSTPGTQNVGGVAGFVADTTLSIDRGFYTQAMDVVIATATPGADIYYTTNGTAPAPDNADAVLYTNPVHVSHTTVLRAAAFEDGYEPTNVDTHTYIFVDDVPRQSVMWPTITQDPTWGPRLTNALRAIPTVSLATGNTISEVESGSSRWETRHRGDVSCMSTSTASTGGSISSWSGRRPRSWPTTSAAKKKTMTRSTRAL